jgi:nucleoside-diphosphate-sugar epimerase
MRSSQFLIVVAIKDMFFLYGLVALFVAPSVSAYFTDIPRTLQPRRLIPPSLSQLDSSLSENSEMSKPILVVGATGKVGRKVVQQLLDMELPVRAMVRNHDKARELFSDVLSSNGDRKELQLVVCDLGTANRESLESAVSGCEAIISVSGAMRFSKLADFLPWRVFEEDASKWCSDKSHPFYVNLQAQKTLIDLATEYKCSRFVRLTGLSSGFSPFNPVSMIFSSVLSLTSRYHFLCEQYLRNSDLPYLILRPGGLAEEDRVSIRVPRNIKWIDYFEK